MSLFNLPSPLDRVFADTENLPVFFDRLMIGMSKLLHCDRCYLYLRDPQLHFCQIAHCHCTNSTIPNIKEETYQTESYYLSETNPLFAAAKQCEPAIFIDDLKKPIENSSNTNFWQQNYKDRTALIQAHICSDGELWGIIQASQFKKEHNKSRPWTRFDRSLISLVIDKTTPLVSVYVKQRLRGSLQFFGDGN